MVRYVKKKITCGVEVVTMAVFHFREEEKDGGGIWGGWRGCIFEGWGGGGEYDEIFITACKMQMPNIICIAYAYAHEMYFTYAGSTANEHWWVVYKIYPWSGLYLGRAAVGWRTPFADSSSRITPGVNVRLAAAPFLWAAPTLVTVPFR